MPIIFKLKNGKKVVSESVYSNLNILAHAQLIETEIGSVCGGHGHCGKDKIIITSGLEKTSPLTSKEEHHLNSQELKRGIRLGCQCFPEDENYEYIVEVV